MTSVEQVHIITGGTSGVGYSILRDLAPRGGHFLFTGSSEENGFVIEHELRTKYPESVFTFFPVDFSEYEGIDQFTRYVLDHFTRIDSLSLNAGVLKLLREENDQGIEKTLMINYLSVYKILSDLEGLLLTGSHSRVSVVAGSPRTISKGNTALCTRPELNEYNGFKAMVSTALCKSMLVFYLSEKWKDKPVSLYVFHPGFVKSKLGRSLPSSVRFLYKLSSLFLSSKSKTAVWILSSQEALALNGRFIQSRKAVPFPRQEMHMRQINKLLESSERILLKAKG